jgi:alpha-beta hydrolase superfamily lysophospholipase
MYLIRRVFLCLVMSSLVGCATSLRQPMLPEILRPTLHKTHAVMADGYRLPYSVWTPADEPKAVVLALHGFNDYRRAFADVGPALARRGIVTYAYDQRGFGETTFRGIWAGTMRMTADVKEFISLLHARHPGMPLYLIGESMGGAVAVTTLSMANPPEVGGVILVAPAVWGRRFMNPFVRLFFWVSVHAAPSYKVTGEGLKIRASDNREMLKALGRDPLVIKETRIDTISGLTDLMDEALAAAPRLKVPSLILYGQHDEVIPKQPVCQFVQALPHNPHPQWRMAIYPDGYHMLTRDLQAKTVLNDIAAWLLKSPRQLPFGDEGRGDHQPDFCFL